MRMPGQNRIQHLVYHLTAHVERAKFDLAADGDDLERRARGGDVPTRISPGKFISGRKVHTAMRVQILQKTLQPSFETDLGDHAGDGDTASSGVPEFAHDSPDRVILRIPAIAGPFHSWPIRQLCYDESNHESSKKS